MYYTRPNALFFFRHTIPPRGQHVRAYVDAQSANQHFDNLSSYRSHHWNPVNGPRPNTVHMVHKHPPGSDKTCQKRSLKNARLREAQIWNSGDWNNMETRERKTHSKLHRNSRFQRVRCNAQGRMCVDGSMATRNKGGSARNSTS